MLRFQLEPMELAWDDMYRLASAQWNEYADLGIPGYAAPFAPSKEMYLSYNTAGMLRVYTARNEKAELVGQFVVQVYPSMHTGALTATDDTWFLTKDYRKGRNALKFLKYVEEDLRLQGVKELHISVKEANGISRIMEAKKYSCIGHDYLKEL